MLWSVITAKKNLKILGEWKNRAGVKKSVAQRLHRASSLASGRSQLLGSVNILGVSEVLGVAADILTAKRDRDAKDDERGTERRELPDFIFEYFLAKEESSSHAARSRIQFLTSVEEHVEHCHRIKWFAILVNVFETFM